MKHNSCLWYDSLSFMRDYYQFGQHKGRKSLHKDKCLFMGVQRRFISNIKCQRQVITFHKNIMQAN